MVLDTNAVLDWLVFEDGRIAPLAAAVEAGTVRWLACAGMRDELERALSYRSLARWCPDSERMLALFDRWVCVCEAPALAMQASLVCSDPDDPWFRGADRLHEKLGALGVTHECHLETRAGGHSWRYFNSMAERAIRFVVSGLEQQSRRLL